MKQREAWSRRNGCLCVLETAVHIIPHTSGSACGTHDRRCRHNIPLIILSFRIKQELFIVFALYIACKAKTMAPSVEELLTLLIFRQFDDHLSYSLHVALPTTLTTRPTQI